MNTHNDFMRWWMQEGAEEWARLVDVSGSALYPWEMVYTAGAKNATAVLQAENATQAERIKALEAVAKLVDAYFKEVDELFLCDDAHQIIAALREIAGGGNGN